MTEAVVEAATEAAAVATTEAVAAVATIAAITVATIVTAATAGKAAKTRYLMSAVMRATAGRGRTLTERARRMRKRSISLVLPTTLLLHG